MKTAGQLGHSGELVLKSNNKRLRRKIERIDVLNKNVILFQLTAARVLFLLTHVHDLCHMSKTDIQSHTAMFFEL